MTKLKDLRADADKQAGSIKRVRGSQWRVCSFSFAFPQFFESVEAGPSSPRKRRKIESEGDVSPSLSQDGFEEAMPGYDEHEDLEGGVDEEEDALASASATEATVGLSKAVKPVSAPAASPPERSSPTRQPKPHSSSSTKGKGRVKDPPDHEERASQTCPICSKAMQVDNREFNAHIDFCLSKGAIREAQAMATSSTFSSRQSTKPGKTGKAPEKQWFKKAKQ